MVAYHGSVTGNGVEFIASVLVQFHEEEAHLRNQEQTSPNMPPKASRDTSRSFPCFRLTDTTSPSILQFHCIV